MIQNYGGNTEKLIAVEELECSYCCYKKIYYASFQHREAGNRTVDRA